MFSLLWVLLGLAVVRRVCFVLYDGLYLCKMAFRTRPFPKMTCFHCCHDVTFCVVH
jgi:hypothetical protein